MEIIKALTLDERVKVLTEGAKYDVSCSSSGSDRGGKKGELGKCHLGGVCHSFTSDGRCISLLKILLSNACEFDCLYCVNRRSNDIERASLEPRELCELVVGFYRRNYIEGLFLSSAVEKSPNHTMQKMLDALILLRNEYKFKGYIHIKAIPGASKELIDKASQFADRMSVNIELPSENSLKLLAPQKKKELIINPMKQLADMVLENGHMPKGAIKKIPAGQTTQMIIGATPESDGQIVRLTEALYRKYSLKRVYFSAYNPVNINTNLPMSPPDLKRENRLYQADWLLRFYGFNAEELLPQGYNLAKDVDPKTDWAIRNIGQFPLEVNTASYEMLLRVPGIGVKNAYRIIEARKFHILTFDALKKMKVVMNRAIFFITANGKYMGIGEKPETIRSIINKNEKLLTSGNENVGIQMSFFEKQEIY